MLIYYCRVLQVFGEGSPREAEGGDDLADDLIYPEDLELFDSDADSDVELGDNSSIKSQDKPKLRYFSSLSQPQTDGTNVNTMCGGVLGGRRGGGDTPTFHWTVSKTQSRSVIYGAVLKTVDLSTMRKLFIYRHW